MNYSKFPKSFHAMRGDIMLEALASTVVLGVMVAGVTQSSRIMFGSQRDAIVQEMMVSQVRDHITNFDPTDDNACETHVNGFQTGPVHERDANSTMVLDCNKTITATIGGREVTGVSMARTASVDFKELDEQFSVGLKSRIEQE